MSEQELVTGSKKGKGAHTPVEAADTLRSTQTVKVLFAVSEGEISSIDDILLNKVSIANYDASFDWRAGTSNQTVIPGFVDTESQLAAFSPSEIRQGNTYSYSISPTVDAVRLTLGLDSLRQVLGNGDMVGYEVSFDINTKATSVSSEILAVTSTKSGKASNPYDWDIIVKRPATTPSNENWFVVVRRTTPNDADIKHNSVSRIVSITQLYYKNLTYPGTALVAVTIRNADQFGGQVPDILIKGKGRKVQVPSNYDPVARTYTGTWDLSMNPVKQFTNNIAWVLYDALHDAQGLAIDSADIDKTSFYLLSQYADQTISDGKGGTIPRYTIGNQFYERQNVPTFIQNLLSLCNAILTENEFGQLKVVFDQPNMQPSRLVTNANVVGGLFNYSSNDLENRYSLANVTYNDLQSYAETNTATWQDDALVTRYGLQTTDIVLPGCNYEAQAIRKARWAVYTNAKTTQILTFKVLFEGLSYRNGSIIKVMDSDNAGVMQHGVVTGTSIAANITTINLDRSITLAAQTYTISFYGTDAVTLHTKTIIQTNATVSAITFTGTEVPLVGSNFILSGTVTPQLYRVIGNVKDGDEYTISALTYDNAKFTYIDQTVTLPVPTGDFVNASSFYSPAVTNIAVDVQSFSDGVNSGVLLHTHWDWNTANTEKYRANFEATWKRDNQDINYIRDIEGNSFDINGAVPGTYDITVWAINPASGIKSTPTTYTYNFRTSAGTSTLSPPTTATIAGTNGLVYASTTMSLYFPYNTVNDSALDSLLDYVVEVWTADGITKKGTFVVQPDKAKGGTFNFSLVDNIATFGTATRQYNVKIYSRDLTGYLSTAKTVTVNNSQPSTSMTVSAVFGAAYLKAILCTDIDVISYTFNKYTAATGGTPAETITVSNNYVDFIATAGTQYWYTVTPNDTFGAGTESTRYSATALNVDVTTWSKSGMDLTIGATNRLDWTAGTIVRGESTSYSIVAGNATFTALAYPSGVMYLYFNPAVSATQLQVTPTLAIAVGVGCYPIATYTGGAATNIKGGDGSAFISGSQVIAGTIGASQLVAGSAVITASAQFGNILQSDNYNNSGGTYSGWRIDKNGAANFNSISIRNSLGNLIFSSGTGLEWSAVTGTGRPADNATVGATFGTNVYGQITAANASTYIADAAIGSAQITDAAITNAKIDRASVDKLQVVTADIVDASVSTLKIEGNAVTVPTTFTHGSGSVGYAPGVYTNIILSQSFTAYGGTQYITYALKVGNSKMGINLSSLTTYCADVPIFLRIYIDSVKVYEALWAWTDSVYAISQALSVGTHTIAISLQYGFNNISGLTPTGVYTYCEWASGTVFIQEAKR